MNSKKDIQAMINQAKEDVRVIDIYNRGYEDGKAGKIWVRGDALSVLLSLGDLRKIPDYDPELSKAIQIVQKWMDELKSIKRI